MAALSLSSAFVNNTTTLSSTTILDGSYVLAISPLEGLCAVATSTPPDAIHLIDRSDCKTVVRTLAGHSDGLHFMRTVEIISGARGVLLSCGEDGSVKAWDERAGIEAIQMLSSGRQIPLMSCDASPDGLLVAAGTALRGEDASILYWDVRSPVAPLREHASTHSDDITAVHFSRSCALLSASTDGLVCISNPYENDEDEAIVHVANWDCSISRSGWLRENGACAIWAVSDMETISLWSKELDLKQDVCRDRLAFPDPAMPWVTDYLIDCHTSKISDSYYFFAGSNEGDFSVISPGRASESWSLEQVFTKGHSEVVRCVYWDETNGLLFSGGEDSKFNVWSFPVHHNESNAMAIDSPFRRWLAEVDEDHMTKKRRPD